jgi:hypothetical protein
MRDLLPVAILVFGFLGLIVWVIWNSESVRLDGEIFPVENMGGLATCDVYVTSVGARHMVEFTLVNSTSERDVEVHFYMTAREARLLSDWIRVAATPGRTLADAQRQMRMSKRPA